MLCKRWSILGLLLRFSKWFRRSCRLMFTIGLLELLFVLSGGLLIWLLVHVIAEV